MTDEKKAQHINALLQTRWHNRNDTHVQQIIRDYNTYPRHTQFEESMRNTKDLAWKTLPVVTAFGIEWATQKNMPFLSLIGIPIAVGGIPIDILKFPFMALGTIASLPKTAITGLMALSEKKFNAEEAQTDKIMGSVKIRLANTCRLLIVMKLETEESIAKKIRANGRDLQVLISLTALNTAFASRFIADDSILLANGNTLNLRNCPAEGIDILSYILEIKNTLRDLKLHEMSDDEAASFIIGTVPTVKRLLENPCIDESISPHIHEIVSVLYRIGTEATQQPSFKKQVYL